MAAMEVRSQDGAGRGAGPFARAVSYAVGRVTIGEPARIFTALGRHRRLFRAWLPFAATLLLRTRLPRADVEVVVLRTAVNCSSAYEWAQHVPLARRAGLGGGAIAAVADRCRTSTLNARQLLLLDAVDELHARRVVSDATWDRLRDRFKAEELIEICALAGHYTMLAMLINTLGLEPEAAALRALEPRELETAQRLASAARSAAAGQPPSVQDFPLSSQ